MFKSRRRHVPDSFQAGERVQITRGSLEGLTGLISAQTKQGHWAVKLEELANGVLVVVSADMLKRLPDGGRTLKSERQ